MILNKLGNWMEAKAISANQLHADTGISLNTIRSIRHNPEAAISPQTLAAICDRYEIPITDLQEAGKWKRKKWIKFE